MAWTELTAQMVLDQFTEDEASAIEAVQGGVESKLPGILQKTIDQARGDIIAGGYDLDPDTTTLPDGLHNDVIAIARWNLLTSIPALAELQTEARKDKNEKALEKLGEIATGKRRVEPPAGSSSQTPAAQWNSENRFTGRMNPTPRPGSQGGGAGRYANDDAPEDAT